MDRDNGTARLPPSLSSSPAANALANHLSAQPRTPRTPNVDDDLSSRFWRGFRGLRGTQEEDPRVPTRHTDTRLPARQTDSSPIPATSWLTPSPRHTVGPYRANMQAIREDTWRRFNEGGQLVPLDREYHLAANFFENLSIDSHQGRLLTAPFFKGDANIRWGPAAIHPRWSFNPALRTPLPIQLRGINFRERLIRTPVRKPFAPFSNREPWILLQSESIALDWWYEVTALQIP